MSSIYFGYEQEYENELKRLNKWEDKHNNKPLIERFLRHLQAVGTKQVRLGKLALNLRHLCTWLDANLGEATKQDIERLVAYIAASKYTDNTRSDYKRALKHFYKWYEEEDPRLEGERPEEARKAYKYLQKHVKTTVKLPEIDPGSILTEEDIKQVIEKGCRYPHEKAFIKLLHETGCRIGELLTVRLKDIQRKETIWLVRVTGKTGERIVPIHASIPYLLIYLDTHPDKNNPDCRLFVSLNNRFFAEPIQYIGAQRILQRTFAAAGVKKKHNPHWFRHSRATLDAPIYTDAIRCKLRGWREGSLMVRRYTHMSGAQVEEAYARAKGLAKPEELKQEPQPIKCVCDSLNPPEAKYCYKCGHSLRMDTALKEQEYLSMAFNALKKIMSDPALREQYEAFTATKSSE